MISPERSPWTMMIRSAVPSSIAPLSSISNATAVIVSPVTTLSVHFPSTAREPASACKAVLSAVIIAALSGVLVSDAYVPDALVSL